ncbi:MAG: hypothetical protein LBL00_05650, partial [Endomicrobium sp.]|nr:hypothetical protein [Endomicrobium sp.]
EKNKKVMPFETIETINKEIIFDVISVYAKRLSETPEDLTALTKLAYSYAALGEKSRESLTWKRILALDSENETARKKLNYK